jgi:WD40 repeat protein
MEILEMKFQSIITSLMGILILLLLTGCTETSKSDTPSDAPAPVVIFATMTPMPLPVLLPTPTIPASDLAAATIPRNQPIKLPDIILPNSNIFSSVAFSPDNQKIVTVDRTGQVAQMDNSLIIYNYNWAFDYDAGYAEFSPDGRTILTSGRGSDQTVHLLDADTGQVISLLQGHSISQATFSPDSSSIATVSADGTVRLWNIADGGERWRFYLPRGRAKFIAFNPNGQSIVVAGNEYNGLLNAVTGQEIIPLTGQGDLIQDVAFSPDGRLIATAITATTRLWDAVTGTATSSLIGHTETVNSVTFSPDGQTILTTSQDGTVRLWSVITQNQMWQTEKNSLWMNSAVFSPDGQIILTVGPWYASLRDVATGQEIQRLSHSRITEHLVIMSPNGQTIIILFKEGAEAGAVGELGQSKLAPTPTPTPTPTPKESRFVTPTPFN